MKYVIPSTLLISLLTLSACADQMGHRAGYNSSTNSMNNTNGVNGTNAVRAPGASGTGTTDTGNNGSTGNPASKTGTGNSSTTTQ